MDRSSLGGYAADSPDARDLLGIEPEIDALAMLIGARAVAPPLSIGLFGAEGSGKSFFMHRLSARLASLATLGATHHDVFCTNLVQVHYNAWHYSGSNPWLGIVERVFEQLDRASVDSADATRLGDGFNSIGTARTLLRELQSKQEHGRQLVARAEAARFEAEQAHDAAVRKHATVVSRSRWSDASSEFLLRLRDHPGALAGIDKAGQTLGLRLLSSNAEHLDQVLEQAKSLSGRAGLLTSSLKTKRYVGNTFLVVLGLVLIGVCAFGFTTLYAVDKSLKAWIDSVGKGLAALSTLFGLVGIWLAAMVRNRASQAIDSLQDREALLRETLRGVDQSRAYEQAVSQEYVLTTQKDVEACRSRVAEATATLTLAEQALRDFFNDGALRRVSAYYRDRILSSNDTLGASIVPIIRRDFEDLTRLMSRPEARYVERIVVFVEDLDQCSPETVAAVLQAIHLLLSFPLFVVVIGARPDWLIHSLKARYSEVAWNANAADTLDRNSVSEALGFLDKVIQIPFWIGAVSRMGAAMVVRHQLEPPVAAPAETLEAPGPMASMATPPISAPAATAVVDSARYDITRRELDVLERMVGYLGGSVRQVKRVANTYRLIRSFQSRDQLAEFLGSEDKPGAYPAVIALLLLFIAEPARASGYREILSDERLQTVRQLLDAFSAVPESADPESRATTRAILESLTSIKADPGALFDLRQWYSFVARFSFAFPTSRGRA